VHTDIHIKEIVNAYYCRTENWSRNFFAPRDFDGIVLFTEGEIEYCFSDKKVKVKKGDLFFLPGNMPYSGEKRSETVAFFVIDFNCFAPDELEKNVQRTVVPAKDYNTAEAKFSEAVDVWTKQRMDRNLKIKSILYSVLCNAVSVETKEKRASLTDAVIDYICDNIRDPSLSVNGLCERFYISKSQLRRNMFNQTGMNPNEYIHSIRLNMAKNELTYTAKSIAEIAENCGFSSPYYFSNCFTKCTGMPPTQYRKRTFNIL